MNFLARRRRRWLLYRAMSTAWNAYLYCHRRGDPAACHILWRVVDDMAREYEAL